MKEKIKSNKLSIDLTDENKSALEKARFYTHNAFGTVINNLIKLILIPHPKVKDALLRCIRNELSFLYQASDVAGDLEKDDINKQISIYNTLTEYLNNGKVYKKHFIKDNVPALAKYTISNGKMYIPKDWIILNPDECETSRYAIIVECRHSNDFIEGKTIPHFVFLTDLSYEEFREDRSLEKVINNLCVQKWSDFQKVIELQVDPIYEPGTSNVLNMEEHLACPYIGYFFLYVFDDERIPNHYRIKEEDLPFGARIIRKK